MRSSLFILSGSVLLSFGLTYLVRRYALSRGVLDVPNARSSHVTPTPRGGGLAIAATAILGSIALTLGGHIALGLCLPLAVAGAVIAVLGYVDDHFSLPALPRFAVHVIVSVFLAWMLVGHMSLAAKALVLPLFAVGIAWSINLFNFMDGIDGLAASQALFVAAASAVLCVVFGELQFVQLLLVTAGACVGFLVWNWPPAKIFMGDVGSAFLGLWLAGIGVLLYAQGSLSIWTSITLNALFIADATSTLLRRVLAGKRWYEAHRSHAYQHLARRWGSHRKVTCLAWVVNVFLILPLAALIERFSGAGAYAAVATILLLMISALAVGAGTEESCSTVS